MTQSVPMLDIVLMIFVLLFCTGVPITLLILLSKRYHAKFSYFVIGCITFPLFALLLEGLLHQAVLSSPVGTTIRMNIALYALYGGLAAGLFEEAGRFVSLSLMMRKGSVPQNALMYGAGHGGIEAFLLVVPTYINNLTYSLRLNAGNIEQAMSTMDESTRTSLSRALNALATTSPVMFLYAVLERSTAIGLHIALSVFVFYGIRQRKYSLVLLAIALHAMVDAVVIFISSYFPMMVVELFVLVIVLIIGFYAAKVYKRMHICRTEF